MSPTKMWLWIGGVGCLLASLILSPPKSSRYRYRRDAADYALPAASPPDPERRNQAKSNALALVGIVLLGAAKFKKDDPS
ncbi:MAG: hypothetical protein HY078_10000 [Elusimicrobia bacterium]|nr:hypothetical protein [Elusimicrobiota bacterium]